MRVRFSADVYCDFCGRHEENVGDMRCSPGPNDAHICNDCIVRLHQGSASEARELEAMARSAMFQLTYLSTAARKARDRKMTRLANDMFYAANRAFHELDNVLVAQRANPEKEIKSHG
jgi:hypothetical protein